MSKRLIPLAAMEQIMRKAGAERVSDKAKEALKDVMEEIAVEISERAIKLAHHSGRKTIKVEDIKLAAKE